MGKEYFILNQARVVYSPGHYDVETARAIAKRMSEREPGKKFTVAHIVDTYQLPRKTKIK